MKKKILLCFSLLLLGVAGFVLINTNSEEYVANAQYESGEWVPEYGGGSTPFRCACVKNLLRTQCRVGDITSNIKLCE